MEEAENVWQADSQSEGIGSGLISPKISINLILVVR